VPPHNLQAEESVLGALLLSRDAIGAVSELGLRPEDFYRPAHQHIYDAVRALYSAGAPADTITVAEELRRNGLLEQVGGTERLHELQNATPAISNAAHYAKIVQETAILRRLIHVASDIAEMAFGEPDDVTKAVDEAESKIFRIAEERVADSTQSLSESIKSVMDRLEETYARGDSITGVPTGYHDIDELLSGLQPSTLNIVGARPAMGKCVAADTPVVDVATGELVTARELVERAAARGHLEVRALGADGRQQTAAVSACVEDGVKPVFRVRTRAGRAVTVTAAHPFLTPRGWQPLAELVTGDEIAVPTTFPVFGDDDADEAGLDALARRCLRTNGLPAAAFRLRRECLAGLLARLFAAQGTVRVEHGAAGVRFSTVEARLAEHVAHALLRFGITATRRRHGTGRREWRHDVEITDGPSLVRFVDEIGVHGRPPLLDVRRIAGAQCPRDTVPVEVWDDIDKARGELPWSEIGRRLGDTSGCDWQPHRRRLRRGDVARLAEVLDDDQLRWWASPDVAWDQIVEITPLEPTEVIDFTVPGRHNFVAADVYLHNTAFGLGMAVNVAKTTLKPVLVFSLEMGHNELTQRILSSEAKVDSSKLRNGRLSESDWSAIGRAIGRLEVPLFLDDNPRVTVMEIRAKARRLKARYGGLALILIDYLQLMSGGGNPENRQLEVSEISRNLKILARELQVPIVALSQLSRNLEARADKRPMLSDLRESGSLEQDADVVMFLYRDEVYNPDSPDKGSAEVIVAKHRSGPIGTKRLVFLGQYTRFDNAARGV
jgi:replicative DNA helicase